MSKIRQEIIVFRFQCYYFFLIFILITFSIEAQSNKTIYIGQFKNHGSSSEPELEKKIYEKLETDFGKYGYKVFFSPEISFADITTKIPKENSHLYLSGYYRRRPGKNLEIFAQIYRPDTGHLIDAVNVEDEIEKSGGVEGIELPEDEYREEDNFRLDKFKYKLISRIRSNQTRKESSERIRENLTNTEIGKIEKFPIRKDERPSETEDVFKILEESVVVTASKKAQKASDAPASVIVITDSDIQKKGYNTILDILRDVSMVDINAFGQGFRTDIGGRGINSNSNMGKYWQILIDGHDMTWRQFYRNNLSPAWLAVDNIKRIEIVKGPNSALWGANAVLGVMNIITKEGVDVGAGQISTIGGSNSTLGTNVTGSRNFGEKGQIYSTISFYNENYERKIKEWSEVKGKDVYSIGNDSKYVNSYTKIKYGNFSINTMFSQDNSHKGVNSFSVGTANNNLFQINKYFTGMHWEKKVLPSLELKSSIYYDQTEWGKDARYEDNPYNGPITDPANPQKNNFGNRRFIQPMRGSDKISGFRFLANYDLTTKMSIISGGNYEYRNTVLWHYPETIGKNYWDVPMYKTFQNGIYTQWSYTPHKIININAGIRHDYDSIFHSKNSPRAGMIIKPTDKIVVKMMYGQAYKAPSLFELYYTRPDNVYGNPLLRPETNKTYETQFIYTPLNWLVGKLTVYSIVISEIIVYQPKTQSEKLSGEDVFKFQDRPTGTTGYRQQANSANRYTSKGTEIELDTKPTKNLMLSLHGSFRWMEEVKSQRTYDSDLIQVFGLKTKTFEDDILKKNPTLYNAAKVQYGGSAAYTLNEKYTFTLIGRFVGSKGVSSTFNGANAYKVGQTGYLPTQTNPGESGYIYNNPIDTTLKSPSYFLLNFVFYWSNVLENLDFVFRVDNILNKEYYDAGAMASGTSQIDVLYGQPGRSAYFKLNYKAF